MGIMGYNADSNREKCESNRTMIFIFSDLDKGYGVS